MYFVHWYNIIKPVYIDSDYTLRLHDSKLESLCQCEGHFLSKTNFLNDIAKIFEILRF